jgi:hypothetical protein
MSVYVGIDVHRKRSQVAVAGQSGEVLVNRNVPNGVEPILRVTGGLPPGTAAASGAAYGTSWLVELLEGYGFTPHLVHSLRCKAIASARLKKPASCSPAPGTCSPTPDTPQPRHRPRPRRRHRDNTGRVAQPGRARRSS